MKTVVLYRTKTGYTKKYAEWIAEDAKADLFDAKEFQSEKLDEYDAIVYCGGLYASRILGFDFIKKNYTKISIKKTVVVAVGSTTKDDDGQKEVMNGNFTSEMKDKVKLFTVRGGLDYKNMTRFDRFIMSAIVRVLKLKKKSNLSDEEKELIDSRGKEIDFTDRNKTKPILEVLKGDSL